MEGMAMINLNKEFWKNKTVLVTGGAGLVGSHIVEELIKVGAKIVVPYIELNPYSYFMKQNFDKEVILVPCDIRDRQKVFGAVSNYEVDIILHLAAQAIVPIAIRHPEEALSTNIMGTVNILEAARHFSRVKAVIVASSDKAYGKSDKLPYVETNELKGEHPYDVSKSCADLISSSYYKCYNVPVVITRFGNIYGPGDLNFSRIIPGLIQSILQGTALDIRSDGKQIREYVYVKDVAKGYLLLAENIDKVKGEAFNFSSAEKLNVIEIVEKASQIIGVKLNYNVLNTAKHEIPEQYLSYEKVKAAVGWQPEHTFEQGIKETFEWYKQNLISSRLLG